MLIAQATDLHLCEDPQHPSHSRFRNLLDHLLTLRPLPEALVLTGDLADDGKLVTYQHLHEMLQRWPSKVQLTVGNHDSRENLLSIFPEASDEYGFVQSCMDLGTWRVVAIDTLEANRAGGGYCSDRARWLATTLAMAPDLPTMIALHHPPTNLGIPWVDPGLHAKWAELLAETIAPFAISGIVAGHVHLGAITIWKNIRLSTSPAVSSDIGLIFEPMNVVAPDNRSLIEQSQPGFTLHRWADRQLYTYFARCPDTVLERWDVANQSAIASMIAERED